MNIEKDEEAFDFLSRLLRQLQQTEQNQRGCNISLVYVASGAQHVNTIQNQNNYCHEKKETKQEDYTDEEVAKALVNIIGKGKPIDTKGKWAGALWMLRWECNYPARAQDFCDRIKRLPLPDGVEFPCEYNNIRMLATLSFMNEDPRQMDKVRYSPNDQKDFFQLREVAVALSQELRKIRDMEEEV